MIKNVSRQWRKLQKTKRNKKRKSRATFKGLTEIGISSLC